MEDYFQAISREFNETRSRNVCLIPFQSQTSIRFTNALQQPHAILNDNSNDKDQRGSRSLLRSSQRKQVKGIIGSTSYNQ